MNIEEKLTTSIISAIKTLYGQDVTRKNGTTDKRLRKSLKDILLWLFSLF